MANAMGQSDGFGFKVITGLNDFVDKHSNSGKKASRISPPKKAPSSKDINAASGSTKPSEN